MNSKHTWLGVGLSMAVPLVVWAGSAVLPFTFSSGTVIKAAEVNANFAALRDSMPRSGSRLKTLFRRTPDGFAQPADNVILDSQLATLCSFSTAADGTDRCLPMSQQSYCPGVVPGINGVFSDSTCQARLYCNDPNSYLPRGAPTYPAKYIAQAVVLPDDAGSAYAIYTPVAYGGTPYSYGSGGVGCVPNPSAVQIYSAGAEVPAASFVQAVLAFE